MFWQRCLMGQQRLLQSKLTCWSVISADRERIGSATQQGQCHDSDGMGI